MPYEVVVINMETDEIVKRLKAPTERQAERIESGLLQQMNLERYCTEIREGE